MAKFYGKQVFKYEGELKKGLQKKLEEVQQKTMQKVYEELLLHIKRRIYNKNPIERDDPFYQRTETLMKIWELKKTYYHGGEYAGIYGGITVNEQEFESHINEKEEENRGWSHESLVFPDINAVDYVNIINNGVDGAHSLFGDIPARPFWDSFLEKMDEVYSDLFIETAREEGLELIGAYYNQRRNRRSNVNKDKTPNYTGRSVVTGVSRGHWAKQKGE